MTWPGVEINQPFPSNAFRTIKANGKFVSFCHDQSTAGVLGAGSYTLFDPITETATTGSGSAVTGSIRSLTNGTTALQCRSTTALTRLTPTGGPSSTATTSNFGGNAPAMAVVGNTVVVFATTGGVRHYNIAADTWSTPGYTTGSPYSSTGGAEYAGGYLWSGHVNSIRQHTAAGQFITAHTLLPARTNQTFILPWGDNLFVVRGPNFGTFNTSTFEFQEVSLMTSVQGYPYVDQANDIAYMLADNGASLIGFHLPTLRYTIEPLPTNRGRRHQPVVANNKIWIGSGAPTSGSTPGTWLKLDLWIPPDISFRGWQIGTHIAVSPEALSSVSSGWTGPA